MRKIWPRRAHPLDNQSNLSGSCCSLKRGSLRRRHAALAANLHIVSNETVCASASSGWRLFFLVYFAASGTCNKLPNEQGGGCAANEKTAGCSAKWQLEAELRAEQRQRGIWHCETKLQLDATQQNNQKWKWKSIEIATPSRNRSRKSAKEKAQAESEAEAMIFPLCRVIALFAGFADCGCFRA